LTDRLCIIGAGAAGLCAARALREAGIAYDQFERHRDVGGMWDITNPWSAIYASTHMISTRRSSQFRDFKMDHTADYPHHTVVGRYFRDFARHFGLYDAIRFGTEVRRVERAERGWRVTLADGSVAAYSGVVVATGHQHTPNLPHYPGRFDGEAFHSFDYSSPAVFEDKRVLVVGGGNSGADIAVDAAHRARQAWISLRRGYHVVPKYAWFGLPIGDMQTGGKLPRSLERRLARSFLRLLVGRPRRYGLPEPDHEPFTHHAIVGSQLLYHLGHGDLAVKPDVAELAGDRVRFTDGSEEAVDVIVWATGYRIEFPFLDPQVLDGGDPGARLALQIFHSRHDDLFFVGLIESVDGGNWRLFAEQAALVAAYLKTRDAPARRARFEPIRTNPEHWQSECAKRHYVRNARYLRAVDAAAGLLREA
jgi:cation diffusion facilitator CzcD-associated flavoprotein CzcO